MKSVFYFCNRAGYIDDKLSNLKVCIMRIPSPEGSESLQCDHTTARQGWVSYGCKGGLRRWRVVKWETRSERLTVDGVSANDNSQDTKAKRVWERAGSLGWLPQKSGLCTRFSDYDNNFPQHVRTLMPNSKRGSTLSASVGSFRRADRKSVV